MTSLRVMISGGGTGGHIYPALAMAEIIRQTHPEAEFCFVGAQSGMEERIIPAAGYRLETLPIRGLQRKLTLQNMLRNVQLPVRWWLSVRKAHRLLKDFKPHVAIGTGGYASLPLLSAASACGIPTAIHEQNAFAGLSNRRLASRVGLVMLGNPAAQLRSARGVTVVTGNPVRADFLTVSRSDARKKLGVSDDGKVVAVLGGSLGALSVNEALVQLLPSLQGRVERIIWQCGLRYADRFSEISSQYPWVTLMPFVEDMPAVMAASDVVVARAGALTLAELATVGCAAVLVPSPHVAGNHQLKNAQAMHLANAALLLPDDRLHAEFQATLFSLLENNSLRQQLAANIRQFAFPNFRQVITTELNKLLQTSGLAEN